MEPLTVKRVIQLLLQFIVAVILSVILMVLSLTPPALMVAGLATLSKTLLLSSMFIMLAEIGVSLWLFLTVSRRL